MQKMTSINEDAKKQNKEENQSTQIKKEKSIVLRRGSSRGFQSFIRLNSISEVQRPLYNGMVKIDSNSLLYDLMKTYQGYDEQSLMKSIVDHLEFTLARTRFSINEEMCYKASAMSIRDRLIEIWNDTQIYIHDQNPKRSYYFSIEYLLGRNMQNALLNLELEDSMRKALMSFGMKLEEIYDFEKDPGLGNGGLGRLAACFLDSLASLNYPSWGYGLRYTFGIFKQKLTNGEQIEIPDYWLTGGNPWEIERTDVFYTVNFYGRTRKKEINGKEKTIWENTQKVKAIAFDNPIPGYDTFNTINLRLWKSTPSEEMDFSKFDQGDYYGSVDNKLKAEIITSVLYPNDRTYEGKELRLKQQYFFVSASIQDIIKRFKRKNDDFANFSSKVAIQLNDTHPALSIVELLRIFLDEYDMEFTKAWNIIIEVFSYTNHTVLPEALEKWGVDMLGNLLPRHLELIYYVNHLWMQKIQALYPHDYEKIRILSIVEESEPKQIRMANLSILGSHKVNGVARMHTKILKDRIFKEFYELDPDKFVSITNGVTQRRWILGANKDLASFYTENLGTSEWLLDMRLLKTLSKMSQDVMFQNKWKKIKNKNKIRVVKWVKKTYNLDISSNALFDVMVKRIHEYKRQLMFCLYILHRYKIIQKASNAERKEIVPRVFFLGGKAAPAYHIAKRIIKFASCIADLVNNNLNTKHLIQFVLLENYRVTIAEKIIPASDLSEHISMAGTEASGTSNMKFCMNGGLIIGTLDGANVEIAEEVDQKNMFIFGKKVDEVNDAKERVSQQDEESFL